MIARDAGGWASATMVDEVYGHVDVHDPVFDAALRTVWGDSGRSWVWICCNRVRLDRAARVKTGWRF